MIIKQNRPGHKTYGPPVGNKSITSRTCSGRQDPTGTPSHRIAPNTGLRRSKLSDFESIGHSRLGTLIVALNLDPSISSHPNSFPQRPLSRSSAYSKAVRDTRDLMLQFDCIPIPWPGNVFATRGTKVFRRGLNLQDLQSILISTQAVRHRTPRPLYAL